MSLKNKGSWCSNKAAKVSNSAFRNVTRDNNDNKYMRGGNNRSNFAILKAQRVSSKPNERNDIGNAH